MEGSVCVCVCVCVACEEGRKERRSFTLGSRSERSVCRRLDLSPSFPSLFLFLLSFRSVLVGRCRWEINHACLLALRGAFCCMKGKAKKRKDKQGGWLLT